eukprot:SAG11_NODE_33504_length_277_cov_0.573034_1_plen_49_part_10
MKETVNKHREAAGIEPIEEAEHRKATGDGEENNPPLALASLILMGSASY